MRARRLETEDSEDSEIQGDESSVESHASPPAKPRPPLMASQSSGVSVVSAVSQWRQRAARAGGCQAAGCVIRVPASESGPASVVSDVRERGLITQCATLSGTQSQ